MICFEITGQDARVGLPVRADPPHVLPPKGCGSVDLHSHIADFVRRYQHLPLRLERLTVSLADEGLLLRPPGHRGNYRGDHKALVHLHDESTARLTSADFELLEGRRTYEGFPPPGVTALCNEEYLTVVTTKMSVINIYLVLSPGGRFRIEWEKPGADLFVRWSRRHLNVGHLDNEEHVLLAA